MNANFSRQDPSFPAHKPVTMTLPLNCLKEHSFQCDFNTVKDELELKLYQQGASQAVVAIWQLTSHCVMIQVSISYKFPAQVTEVSNDISRAVDALINRGVIY